ncbi:class I SAM-dependent methyltransferase [Caproiciproducens galactitolivorans]|uniref:Class I SAM-dependent methyltransferase n=1 Tax=Caproiciproducens galactitolivorans TaxID=642589 RepID=A0ABT4BVM2_9FIRM|nr:class I SAM-dependent methyltransferase [Caproiciproducens galactitolivorans]MCY1713983.1 class I SAM-dependent methyltransferase [Caproiciproducens galactitolivorans]
MLDREGFDLWANGYDKSVSLSEETNEYPFAGYKNVLNQIYRTVKQKENASVFDIGFGTGILTKKLYDDGFDIYGIDFSEKMIEIAKNKMPKAELIQYDFSNGLPPEIENIKFDFIICTYAIHHLNDEQKIAFIHKLQRSLRPDGKILIGDVAFETEKELEECKANSGENWDNDESYIIFKKLAPHFCSAKFHKISYCSGVVTLTEK